MNRERRWKTLKSGDRILTCPFGYTTTSVKECTIREISPSCNYINIGEKWFYIGYLEQEVKILEILPRLE